MQKKFYPTKNNRGRTWKIVKTIMNKSVIKHKIYSEIKKINKYNMVLYNEV